MSSANLSIDPDFLKKVGTFSFMRSLLLMSILLSTVFLRREVLGTTVILQLYAALTLTFLLTLIITSYWQEALKIRYFIQSQLLFDLLLVSYFVFLTGINESIYLFLYLMNIVFTALIYYWRGAMIVGLLSGFIYAIIFYINSDTNNVESFHTLAYNELFFFLTALLAGQFMEESRRQRILLSDQQANITRLETINDKLINNIPVGILLVNENEALENINKTALQLLQISSAPRLPAKVYDFIPALKGIQQAWQIFPEESKLRYKFPFYLPKGKKKMYSLQIVSLPGEENENRFIYVFQDVSKISELEEKLEMESRLATVGQLAAGIAHEIRNPLASISGSIETLNQNLNVENPEDKKLIAISLREIKRLNKLITEFLEFAKPKEEVLTTFSLKKLVTEVSEAIQMRTSDLVSTDFVFNIDESLALHADPERMKQVFFNIFINAIEASENKKIKIQVEATDTIDVVRIRIRDNGPGIPDTIAKKIFDPFFTTKKQGTGLGLATVAQLLKLHKGEIRISPSESGSCFEILLPSATRRNIERTA